MIVLSLVIGVIVLLKLWAYLNPPAPLGPNRVESIAQMSDYKEAMNDK